MMVNLKAKYKYDMSDEELEKYVSREEDQVIAKLKEKLRPCEGVDAELEKLEKKSSHHLSVVSSSALRRVKASIEKAGQDKYFDPNHVFSAATSLPKPTSKPDPAIYLHAMAVLGKKAEECVAVEDSRSGATAAYRAKIVTIGYVGSYDEEEKEKMRGVLKGAGVVVVMEHWREFEECLEGIESGKYVAEFGKDI
jgi:HAD superfamily hydrolase (TIGR01509 family)